MATEKRLIDANELKEKATLRHGFDFQGIFVRVQDIDNAPTVDAEPVVRCKYCKFSVINSIYDPMECVKWRTKWGVCYTNPEGYCHKGERI